MGPVRGQNKPYLVFVRDLLLFLPYVHANTTF